MRERERECVCVCVCPCVMGIAHCASGSHTVQAGPVSERAFAKSHHQAGRQIHTLVCTLYYKLHKILCLHIPVHHPAEVPFSQVPAGGCLRLKENRRAAPHAAANFPGRLGGFPFHERRGNTSQSQHGKGPLGTSVFGVRPPRPPSYE